MNLKLFMHNHHGKMLKFFYIGFTISAAALLLFPTPAPATVGLIFTIFAGALTFVNSLLEYHHSITQYRAQLQKARDKNNEIFNTGFKSRHNNQLEELKSITYYKIPSPEFLLIINALAPLMGAILAILKLLAVIDVIGAASLPSILVGLVIANLIVTTLIDKVIDSLIQSKVKKLDELDDQITEKLTEEKGKMMTVAIKRHRPTISDNLDKLPTRLLAETLEIDAVSLFNPPASELQSHTTTAALAV